MINRTSKNKQNDEQDYENGIAAVPCGVYAGSNDGMHIR